MLTIPKPDQDETVANASFDGLLWALSRPGLIRSLPVPGEQAIVSALIDRECTVCSNNPELMKLIKQTGAVITDIPEADYVFFGDLSTTHLLGDVRIGSDLYPDAGATVILSVKLNQGKRIRLSGPGIRESLVLDIGGLPEGFWQQREEIIRYPMGFDLFLIDSNSVIGIPRPTVVELM